MSVTHLFRMPSPMKITGRSSSITNAFINSIVPSIEPTKEQIAESLSILRMDQSSFSCSYCGDPASEWDHFRPLVKDKKPRLHFRDPQPRARMRQVQSVKGQQGLENMDAERRQLVPEV